MDQFLHLAYFGDSPNPVPCARGLGCFPQNRDTHPYCVNQVHSQWTSVATWNGRRIMQKVLCQWKLHLTGHQCYNFYCEPPPKIYSAPCIPITHAIMCPGICCIFSTYKRCFENFLWSWVGVLYHLIRSLNPLPKYSHCETPHVPSCLFLAMCPRLS